METIYLDYAATTPIDPAVLMAMHTAEKRFFANASSIHSLGQLSKDKIEQARQAIAHLIKANPNEIVFTSGGTESNNLAVLGGALANKPNGNHIIATSIEHPSVLKVCNYLSNCGFDIDYITVDVDGKLNLNQLKTLVRSETILVSIMMVNNETGCILPIKEIGEFLSAKKIIFHIDAVQACGKLEISVEDLNADLLTISAHKIYGPKGIGALFIRKGTPLRNILFGGIQEVNRRPGTENIVAIVGFAEAVEQLVVHRSERKRVLNLRDHFEAELIRKIPQIQINGIKSPRIYSHSNIHFPFLTGDAMLMNLDMMGIAVSTGSACGSGSPSPSHVLSAMNFDKKRILNSIRITLGRYTTESEIVRVIQAIDDIYRHHKKRTTESDV
jgi:cysteine desulfurase